LSSDIKPTFGGPPGFAAPLDFPADLAPPDLADFLGPDGLLAAGLLGGAVSAFAGGFDTGLAVVEPAPPLAGTPLISALSQHSFT